MNYIIKVWSSIYGPMELYTDDGRRAALIAAQGLSAQFQGTTKVYFEGEDEGSLVATFNNGIEQ